VPAGESYRAVRVQWVALQERHIFELPVLVPVFWSLLWAVSLSCDSVCSLGCPMHTLINVQCMPLLCLKCPVHALAVQRLECKTSCAFVNARTMSINYRWESHTYGWLNQTSQCGAHHHSTPTPWTKKIFLGAPVWDCLACPCTCVGGWDCLACQVIHLRSLRQAPGPATFSEPMALFSSAVRWPTAVRLRCQTQTAMCPPSQALSQHWGPALLRTGTW